MADILLFQSLVNQFGQFDIQKLDINEVTQYALINKMLEQNGNNKKAFAPPLLQDSDPPFNFRDLFYMDSQGQNEPESTNEIINYFLSKKYSEDLLKISNKDIASLVSFIRFSRVSKENNKPNFKKATEIKFATHYNANSFQTIAQDNSGVGLSSLKVEVISNTGAYYSYKVSMSIYFANAKILNNDNYKLLLKTPTVNEHKEPVVYSIVFGWANTKNGGSKVKELYEEKTCLLLNIVNYELSFQQDGSVNLTLNFIGAAETATNALSADVLINKYQYQEDTKELQQTIDNATKAKEQAEKTWIEKQNTLQIQISSLQKEKTATSDATKIKEIDSTVERLQQEINGNPINNPNGSLTAYQQYQKALESANEVIKTNQTQIDFLIYSSLLKKMFSYGDVYQGLLDFRLLENQQTAIIFESQDYYGSPTVPFKVENWDSSDKIIKRNLLHQDRSTSALSQDEQDLIDAFTEIIPGSTTDITQYTPPEQIIKEQGFVSYGNVYFKYMTVGDILATVADNMYCNMSIDKSDILNTKENNKIVLGTIDMEQVTYQNFFESNPSDSPSKFVDFVSSLTNQLANTSTFPIETKKITLDISYIPIAYNVFASWFFKNVVEKNIKNYPFNNFVKDFLNDCVLKCLQDYSTWEAKFRFFGKTPASSAPRPFFSTSLIRTSEDDCIEMAYIDLPYDLQEALDDTRKVSPSDIKAIFQDSTKRKKYNPFVDQNELLKPIYKYAFIYGKYGKISRNGKYKENLSNGIYHFYVGATTGILKDIKFVPMNSPARYTAQIERATADIKGKPLDTKFNVIQRYDVNISCIGFQYFKPGQIIFVDTSLLGYGKSSQAGSIARDFTLGGYYLITNVSHEFDKTDFTTSIIAKFTDYGKGA